MKRTSGIDTMTVSQRDHWRNQPRDPKGTETGGQWTDEGAVGSTSDLKGMIDNPDDFVDFLMTKVSDDYEGSVGLRGLYSDEEIGDLHPSLEWEDGVQLDNQLSGTSIVGLSTNYADDGRKDLMTAISKYAKESFKYGDGNIGLVLGDPYPKYGNDTWANEIIVPNARVVYIWKRR